jgi:2-succinyl-5-enolpyruvyl-6-hydroxy-3-cyclohexene-1-carboxylate synthase
VKLPPANLNSLWASLIVEEFVRNGIDHFCLAPGSRCTPLTVAIADNPNAKPSIHYDERGVAFHALGYGRATGRPAVVVTTSGTAVPNTMPAVVEAAMDHVPLVVLTADRPPELRGTAANQTIDQIKIFGDYVQWFAELPCPELQCPPPMVLTTIDQTVRRSCGAPGGPVHVNCMFREPLAPEPQQEDLGPYLASVGAWLEHKKPYTTYALPKRISNPETQEAIVDRLQKSAQGLVVVGGLRNVAERDAVSYLIKRLQWPVCADITSGLRLGDTSGCVMGFADILVRSRLLAGDQRPDTILHVGGRVVSKHVASYIAVAEPSAYILIANHPDRQDPAHGVSLRVEGEVAEVCASLAARLERQEVSSGLALWQPAMSASKKAFERFAVQEKNLSEPLIASLISQNIPPDHGLFVASSMPVRDMDVFADVTGPAVPVGANRGASGVDGTVAAAAGFAEGLQRPVTLLVGDLALLHDLNSLNYLRHTNYPVVAVVINNNGGGIFSFLPIARFEQYYEKYFITPHDLTFEHGATMFGLSYYRPKDCQEFLSHYQEALREKRSAIVEVRLDREENYARHAYLVAEMLKAIDN